MSKFEWYEGKGGHWRVGPALVVAGLPEDLLEWDIKDLEETAGKHDCTDQAGFYEDPEAPGTGYWVNSTCSYNNGIQSVYMDTGKVRRVMKEVTKMEPAYEPI